MKYSDINILLWITFTFIFKIIAYLNKPRGGSLRTLLIVGKGCSVSSFTAQDSQTSIIVELPGPGIVAS